MHAHAIGACLHHVLDGTLHRTAKAHASTELFGDVLCNELRVEFGLFDLDHVELNALAGQLVDMGAEPVGFRTASPDDDSRARCVNIDTKSIASPFDLDPADQGMGETARDEFADLPILDQVVRVLLVGEPPRLPIGCHPEPKAVWIDLVAHQSSSSGISETSTVMWLVRFRIGVARPRARGNQRFDVGPSSTNTFDT